MTGNGKLPNLPAGIVLVGPSLMFFTPGMPRPQGSMQAIVSRSTGRAFMKQSPTLHEWRNAVMQSASSAMESHAWPTLDEGPVHLHTDFYFARPKSHSKKRRSLDGGIKDNGSDLDKLVRAIGDALTYAGVYGDDRQITSLQARKFYAEQPQDVGAVVMVTRVAFPFEAA
jgi:crossover junction endodeoxyribonuclease RusA